jgi:hypothetical protein
MALIAFAPGSCRSEIRGFPDARAIVTAQHTGQRGQTAEEE